MEKENTSYYHKVLDVPIDFPTTPGLLELIVKMANVDIVVVDSDGIVKQVKNKLEKL